MPCLRAALIKPGLLYIARLACMAVYLAINSVFIGKPDNPGILLLCKPGKDGNNPGIPAGKEKPAEELTGGNKGRFCIIMDITLARSSRIASLLPGSDNPGTDIRGS
jgi:hypothetical protein